MNSFTSPLQKESIALKKFGAGLYFYKVLQGNQKLYGTIKGL
jgi:hypothetical protein